MRQTVAVEGIVDVDKKDCKTWAVLWPDDPGHSPGLRPSFFSISYVNPYEFLI